MDFIAFYHPPPLSPVPLLKRAKDNNRDAAAEAMMITVNPYTEYIQMMEAFVYPVFEALVNASSPGGDLNPTTTSGMNSGRPGSEPDVTSNAYPVSKGETGQDATAVITPGSVPAASVISELGVSPEATSPRPEIRVFYLDIGDDSSAERDFEAAHAMLPLPAVPAPDPKLLPIPSDKLRQLFRRSPSRLQKIPPMESLEILPWFESSDDSFSPSVSNSTLPEHAVALEEGRDNKRSDAVNIDNGKGSVVCSENGDNLEPPGLSGEQRAVSGPVNDNPYRWVVRRVESQRCKKSGIGSVGVGQGTGDGGD